MDVTPYLDTIRRDLAAASDAAGPDGRAAADRMLLALEPAMRLVLLEVLSQAAAEITAELPRGVVEVRLRGREPELVVDVPPAAPPTAHSEPVDEAAEPDDEDVAIARVSLRIPESVKTRAEELAGRGGMSLNSWIVGLVRGATQGRRPLVDIDVSSIPFPGDRGGRRMTGWA